jgi:predicted TIM-barrel fold metal-dependent hydrolase
MRPRPADPDGGPTPTRRVGLHTVEARARMPSEDEAIDGSRWIISVDDHVIEPKDVWQDRVPARLRDRAPRWQRDDEGGAWVYEDRRFPLHGLNAISGLPKEEWSVRPLDLDTIRPAYYDAKARVDDMDADGVLAQVNFPSFPRFCGQTFLEASDRELALLCVRAYNDWMLDEWCATAPRRFIPLVLLPLWDPRAAAAEIERTASKGAKAVAFSENPSKLGLPSIHDRGGYWDPLLATAAAAGLPICTHIGSSSSMPMTSPDCPTMVTMCLFGFIGQSTFTDWMYSGKFQQYPDLKLVLSEGGVAWIPATLARMQRDIDRKDLIASDASSFDANDLITGDITPDDLTPAVAHRLDFSPYEVFRRNIFGCMIADDYGWGAVDELGSDNIMVETDYPHPDSSFPHSIEVAAKELARFSADVQYKIFQGNARRVFAFEPAVPA